MLPKFVILGFWLAAGAALVGQTAQPPANPSPVIIAPPAPAPKADSASGVQQAPSTSATPGSVAKPAGKSTKQDKFPPIKDAVSPGATYVIGPEDVLYIRVWQQPELSGSVKVASDGTISLQLIDEVKASGLTRKQLEEELATRFKKFIIEPEVNVQVINVNSQTYIIQGASSNVGPQHLTRWIG